MNVVPKAEIKDIKDLLANAARLKAVVKYYPCEITYQGKTRVFDSEKDVDDFLKEKGLGTPAGNLVGKRFILGNAEFCIISASQPVPVKDYDSGKDVEKDTTRYTLDVIITKVGI